MTGNRRTSTTIKPKAAISPAPWIRYDMGPTKRQAADWTQRFPEPLSIIFTACDRANVFINA